MRCNGHRNETRYDSALIERGGVTGNSLPIGAAMVMAERDLRNAARRYLAAGGVIEDALSSVLQGSKDEFQCKILFLSPSKFLVDGCEYTWPAPAHKKEKLPPWG